MRELQPFARIAVSLLAVTALAGGYYVLSGGDLDLGQRDGPEYLGVAVSFTRGDGLRVPFGEPGGAINPSDSTGPLVFYPPGVSLLLSLPLSLGIAPTTAATVLQGLAVAIGGLLTYIAMRELATTGRSGLFQCPGTGSGSRPVGAPGPSPAFGTHGLARLGET